MTQQLVDEMTRATVEDIISVISFEFDDEKKSELLLGIVNDMTMEQHSGQLTFDFGEM